MVVKFLLKQHEELGENERTLMIKCDSQFIIKLIDTIHLDFNFGLVMEFCEVKYFVIYSCNINVNNKMQFNILI